MDRNGGGRPRVRLASVAALLFLPACGPISTTLALRDAEVAVASAEAVGAPRFATYEYVRATEYIRKAREEEGYSDFQAAMDLAAEARTSAEAAHARALKNPLRGSAPAPPPNGALDTDDPSDGGDRLGEPDPAGSHL